MKASIRADLYLYQGDDWAGIVSVTDNTGEPADLTGYTARSQIRRKVADEDESIDVEINAVISDSSVVLGIGAAETKLLTGNYVWDLELVGAEGGVTTILAGRVEVTAEVTRVSA